MPFPHFRVSLSLSISLSESSSFLFVHFYSCRVTVEITSNSGSVAVVVRAIRADTVAAYEKSTTKIRISHRQNNVLSQVHDEFKNKFVYSNKKKTCRIQAGRMTNTRINFDLSVRSVWLVVMKWIVCVCKCVPTITQQQHCKIETIWWWWSSIMQWQLNGKTNPLQNATFSLIYRLTAVYIYMYIQMCADKFNCS